MWWQSGAIVVQGLSARPRIVIFLNKVQTTTFNNIGERNKTTQGKPYEIKWDITDRAMTFNPVNRKCLLCLKEIFYIMFRPESATLNSTLADIGSKNF